jgi:hypothetical protein
LPHIAKRKTSRLGESSVHDLADSPVTYEGPEAKAHDSAKIGADRILASLDRVGLKNPHGIFFAANRGVKHSGTVTKYHAEVAELAGLKTLA